MVIKNNWFIYLSIYLCFSPNLSGVDLTIMGQVKFSDSLAGLAPNLIDSLKNDISINFISTGYPIDLDQMPETIKNTILTNLFFDQKQVGKVIIYTDIIWYNLFNKTYACTDFLPKKRNITLAYSMLESDKIPDNWVKILNLNFDAVLVPDEFLINVYQRCGVKIPIFMVPYPIYLKDFFARDPKITKNKVFTFGMSATGAPHKNFELLLEAFCQQFKNDKTVLLKLHTRRADKNFIQKIKNYISRNRITNVQFINKYFSRQEYIEFLSSLDCYVLISGGEGFSVTPREASALGIPCILSDNSAHKTICKTGFVLGVEAKKPEPAYYQHLKCYSGNFYTCNIDDIRKALHQMEKGYEIWLTKAQEARNWIRKYSTENVKHYFLNFIKPKQVILGEKNIVTKNRLITNSKDFFDKLKNI